MPPLPSPQPQPEPEPRRGHAPGDATPGSTGALQSQPMLPPTAEAYARVKALFDAVCELDDALAVRARLTALAAAPPQCEEVLALWQADAAGRTRLGAPVAGMLASASQSAPSELAVGATLGAWRLVAHLGAGGMGQVFLAERDDRLYEQRLPPYLSPHHERPDSLHHRRRAQPDQAAGAGADRLADAVGDGGTFLMPPSRTSPCT